MQRIAAICTLAITLGQDVQAVQVSTDDSDQLDYAEIKGCEDQYVY